jgi:hypothetical protein
MLFIYITCVLIAGNPTVANCRAWFHEASEKKESCQLLMKNTSQINEKSDAVLIGYKGAALMMWSKHITGAISKLSMFNNGKAWLEKAIKKNSQALELRYLRFCFQCTVPALLNYTANRDEDKKFLLNNALALTDADLKTRVKNFMLGCKYVNETEKKTIREQWNR